MFIKLFISLLLLTPVVTTGQSLASARKTLDVLTSPAFWGRGYTNRGMEKAGKYLEKQFKTIGLQTLPCRSFLQEFTYDVNTFPGAMQVVVDGKALVPGRDFIVSSESAGFKGSANLNPVSATTSTNSANTVRLTLAEKLTWSVADKASDYTNVLVKKNVLKDVPRKAYINIEQQEVKQFKAANIVGMVEGRLKPDSFVVLTAHYDHLGGMGSKTFFPGANDNASGVAMLLELARFYHQHPPAYSVVFICFAGEEAGLIGSKYFTTNPLFPLDRIRFLTNLDLVGTGEEGITVVNATTFPTAFAQLNLVNDSSKLVTKINPRGKAANSDHYWFSEKGVPAFFIYTLGGIRAYHDVDDRAETLPYNEFEDLVTLLIRFNKWLMNEN